MRTWRHRMPPRYDQACHLAQAVAARHGFTVWLEADPETPDRNLLTFYGPAAQREAMLRHLIRLADDMLAAWEQYREQMAEVTWDRYRRRITYQQGYASAVSHRLRQMVPTPEAREALTQARAPRSQRPRATWPALCPSANLSAYLAGEVAGNAANVRAPGGRGLDTALYKV